MQIVVHQSVLYGITMLSHENLRITDVIIINNINFEMFAKRNENILFEPKSCPPSIYHISAMHIVHQSRSENGKDCDMTDSFECRKCVC